MTTEIVRGTVTSAVPLLVLTDGAVTPIPAESFPTFTPVVGARVWAAVTGASSLLVLDQGA